MKVKEWLNTCNRTSIYLEVWDTDDTIDIPHFVGYSSKLQNSPEYRRVLNANLDFWDFDYESANEPVNYYFKLIVSGLKNESKSRKSSRKLGIRESAQQNVAQDLAEKVAQAMQDMDWRDWLADSYDTYEEEWNAFVDYVWDELYNDPASVVQALHEIGADEGLINEVAKNCSKWYGIYARDYSNGIPVILKFNTLEEAEDAGGMLPDIHALDSDSDFVGAGDYTSTVLDDYNCEGYIEVSRRDIDRNLVGNAFTYDYELYYIVNGDDWFDIL